MLAQRGHIPSGGQRNRIQVDSCVRFRWNEPQAKLPRKLPMSNMGRSQQSPIATISSVSGPNSRILEQRYASTRSEMVPVYRRRHVGKTELLLRFASGKPTVLFIASDKLRTPQIADLLRAAAEWLATPHLAEFSVWVAHRFHGKGKFLAHARLYTAGALPICAWSRSHSGRLRFPSKLVLLRSKRARTSSAVACRPI